MRLEFPRSLLGGTMLPPKLSEKVRQREMRRLSLIQIRPALAPTAPQFRSVQPAGFQRRQPPA